MIEASACLCVRQDIFVGKTNVVQSPVENSPVPLWTFLIPQAQEKQIPSGKKANNN